MSLVNDALRRATEAQKNTTAVPPKLPLRPAAAPVAPKGIGFAWPVSLALFVGTICLVGWLNHRDLSLPVHARTPEVNSANVSQPAAVAPVAAPLAVVTNSIAQPVEAPAPKPAPLKLQAVFFNPRNPSAIISSKTVFVGDAVGDFRVEAIASNSALLISATATNVLTLE